MAELIVEVPLAPMIAHESPAAAYTSVRPSITAATDPVVPPSTASYPRCQSLSSTSNTRVPSRSKTPSVARIAARTAVCAASNASVITACGSDLSRPKCAFRCASAARVAATLAIRPLSEPWPSKTPHAMLSASSLKQKK